MTKYKILYRPKGDGYSANIVDESGEVLVTLQGPMMSIAVLVLCETLNAGVNYDDWASRLNALINH